MGRELFHSYGQRGRHDEVAFCSFVKMPNNLSPASNKNPAVQPTALNAMRKLGGPNLRLVRGSELLMALFIIFL